MRQDAAREWLPEIIDLLRANTAYDFTLYKPGTLERRIERRMAAAAIDHHGSLSRNTARRRQRARSSRQGFADQRHRLLPRSTGVRSPGGEHRSRTRARPSPGPSASHLDRRVQHGRGDLFARHAVSRADRGGESATSNCRSSPPTSMRRRWRAQETASIRQRSRRMCRRRGLRGSFRGKATATGSSPELRASVVFTVQDVLADPPFSRLDLVSCRNLLIYLRPEAQAKVVSLFHFALREGGVLLLGNSETLGAVDGRFEVDLEVGAALPAHRSSPAGRVRPFDGRRGWLANPGAPGPRPALLRQTALAELCRRLVIENYAPAAALINRQYECLYLLGPTDRYLRVPPGPRSRSSRHGAGGGAHQASVGDPTGLSGQGASCRRRRSDASRRRRLLVQHRRRAGSQRGRRASPGLLHRRAEPAARSRSPGAAP